MENYHEEFPLLVIATNEDFITEETADTIEFETDKNDEKIEVEIIEDDNVANEKKNYSKTVGTEYNEREVNIQELFKHW